MNLGNIDFDNHDGVYLSMLNDVSRNQFYDQILLEVKGHDCVEIGFGTGLLSMLALKHGARSIVAYEADPDRYRLGCEVIKVLQLHHRVTLINQRYDHTCDHSQTVVFTETVDDNIWGEGLYNSLPRQSGRQFLPGQYFLEIHAEPISTDVACNLIRAHEQHYFSPGVDVDRRFVSYVNLLLSKKYNKPVKLKAELPNDVTELTPMPTLTNWVCHNTCAARYVIDANVAFENDPVRKIQLYTGHQPMLIVPRAGMQHNNHRLYLDTGHWKPPANPAVINAPRSLVTVEHDLRTGKISYKIKERQ